MWLWHVHSWGKWTSVQVNMQTVDYSGNVTGKHEVTKQTRECATCGLKQRKNI